MSDKGTGSKCEEHRMNEDSNGSLSLQYEALDNLSFVRFCTKKSVLLWSKLIDIQQNKFEKCLLYLRKMLILKSETCK